MNSVELLEKKTALVDEAKTICNGCKAEIRNFTDDEKSRVESIKNEIETINGELRQLAENVEIPHEKAIKTSNIRNKMNKDFSLLSAIRNVAENKQQDAVIQAVIDNGAREMRAAGVNYVGQIQIPMSEEFRTVTVATEHDDVIATNMMDVLEPLHAKNTLLQSGVKFLSNLKGDVQYPILSSINATWEGETATVSDSTPTFANVKLQPHRLSVCVPVSKQFLVQDSAAAEAALRNEIINSINAKLEATILGSAAATANQPAGLFYSATTLPTVSNFAAVCGLESDIETANMEGYRYIVSPKAKAALRAMSKGSNINGNVYANGEIDGVPTLTTSNISNKGIICADFSQMVLAQFGNLDLTIDNVTLAAAGCVRLIVNSYWDFKVLRTGAFKVANVA